MGSRRGSKSLYSHCPDHRTPLVASRGQHPCPSYQPSPAPPPSSESSGYAGVSVYALQGSTSAPDCHPADLYHAPKSYSRTGIPDCRHSPRPDIAPEQQPRSSHPALYLETTPKGMPEWPLGPHPPPGHAYRSPSQSTNHPRTAGGYHHSDQRGCRKVVRALQACNSCRQRKAKCDEGRPKCQHCKDNGLDCSYREKPQPKSEEQVLATTEELKELSDDMELLIANQKMQEAKLQTVLDMHNDCQGASQLHDRDGRNTASTKPPSLHHRQSEHPQTQVAKQGHATDSLRQHQTGSGELWQGDGKSELEFSMPPKHTTAVDNLFDWPSIQILLPKYQTTSYVMDTEMSRALLRLNGCGEGEDKDDDHESVLSPSSSPSSGRVDDGTSISSPQQAVWGSCQSLMPPNLNDRYLQEHPGSLSRRGGLMLYSYTIDRFFRSYMENMHILHPFLEPEVLRNMIQVFKRKYSWGCIQPAVSVGEKRKREISEQCRPLDEFAATSKLRERTDRSINATSSVIEYSVANAIILLVLALGKVCAHREQLPGAVSLSSIRTSTTHDHETSDSEPAPSLSTPASSSGQHFLDDDNSPMAVSSPDNSLDRDTDKIAGLSYFAKAAKILGELPGGVRISHIQANLLAGLYMGQLARILPSHYYISMASRACQVVIESTAYRAAPGQPGAMKPSRRNLINFAFWSCLQLESDILAEIDLPPSGITRYESRQHEEMPTAATLRSIPESNGQEDILRFYSYQVQLRRTMNDIHSMLYRPVAPGIKSSEPVLALLDVLDTNLDLWRDMLYDWAWNEDDHQSTKINVARMRAKYYGAKYIIHRPALRHALRVVADQSPTPNIKQCESPQADPGSACISPLVSAALLPTARHRSSGNNTPPGSTTDIIIEADVLRSARKCVDAAIRSTTAFDAISGSLIITNVFGTLHAQFGNMLVLSATFTCKHPDLSSLITGNDLRHLFSRTIAILHRHAEISPVLAKDVRILEHVRHQVFPEHYRTTSITLSVSNGMTRELHHL